LETLNLKRKKEKNYLKIGGVGGFTSSGDGDGGGDRWEGVVDRC
jgi:hypothetical protein